MEENGGQLDGVVGRVVEGLRDLGGQGGVEGGATRFDLLLFPLMPLMLFLHHPCNNIMPSKPMETPKTCTDKKQTNYDPHCPLNPPPSPNPPPPHPNLPFTIPPQHFFHAGPFPPRHPLPPHAPHPPSTPLPTPPAIPRPTLHPNHRPPPNANPPFGHITYVPTNHRLGLSPLAIGKGISNGNEEGDGSCGGRGEVVTKRRMG